MESDLHLKPGWFQDQLREVKASLAAWDQDRLNEMRREVNATSRTRLTHPPK